MSYEGVSSCRPPTERTPLPGFGDQVGPRPWPRRSCSCVRRACPASSLSRAGHARHSWARNGEGPGTIRFAGPWVDPMLLDLARGRRSSARRTRKSRRAHSGASSSIRYVP